MEYRVRRSHHLHRAFEQTALLKRIGLQPEPPTFPAISRTMFALLPALRITAMPIAVASARLEARISAKLHATLKRAAQIQGRTMTDFVISAVQDAAQRAIEESNFVQLSLADQACFAQALLSPPRPTAALKRAFIRRRKLVSAE